MAFFISGNLLHLLWSENFTSFSGRTSDRKNIISGIYYICYGQKILRLSVEEPLTKEQIQVVEERLKLKE